MRKLNEDHGVHRNGLAKNRMAEETTLRYAVARLFLYLHRISVFYKPAVYRPALLVLYVPRARFTRVVSFDFALFVRNETFPVYTVRMILLLVGLAFQDYKDFFIFLPPLSVSHCRTFLSESRPEWSTSSRHDRPSLASREQRCSTRFHSFRPV